MTKNELVALGGLQTRTGANLREIGLAALEAGRTKGRAEKMQPAPSLPQKRYVVGIDPGVKTGFAVWDRERKSFTIVETTTFWELFLGVQRSTLYNVSNTYLVIEIANYAPTFRERRSKASSVGVADRMSRNVGGVSMMADLLVEGFRLLGYEVVERKPVGKVKKNGEYDAEEDRRQFEQLTGWTERTSQHARDAGRLVFKR